MKVAVLVSGNDFLVRIQDERCFGSFACLQILYLESSCSGNGNKLNEVRRYRRVLHSRYRNLHQIAIHFYNGNMFLSRTIACVRYELSHFLATAKYRDFMIHHLRDDIATMLAFIKFECHKLLVFILN